MEKMEEKKDNKIKKRIAVKRKRKHLPDVLGLKGSEHILVLWKPGRNVKF
jgi:hypothetical protein